MQSKDKKKIIYSDDGRDIAIVGIIIDEDDFFLTVIADSGIKYKIGKKAIVCIKERSDR